MRVPTVKIVANNKTGFIVINQADFDPAKHVEYDPAAPVAQNLSPPKALAKKQKRKNAAIDWPDI